MLREAVALMLDVPEESFDLRVLPAIGGDVDAILDNLAQAREAARLAERRLTAATRQAVDVLTSEHGLTVRDAGAVMGVSFQRVSQVMQQLMEVDDVEEELGEFGGGTFGNGAHLVSDAGTLAGSGAAIAQTHTRSGPGTRVVKAGRGDGRPKAARKR
jgi:hypothetical protein